MPTSTVVTPWLSFGVIAGSASSRRSSCVWTSMKPGASTSPRASTTSSALPGGAAPTAVMRAVAHLRRRQRRRERAGAVDDDAAAEQEFVGGHGSPCSRAACSLSLRFELGKSAAFRNADCVEAAVLRGTRDVAFNFLMCRRGEGSDEEDDSRIGGVRVRPWRLVWHWRPVLVFAGPAAAQGKMLKFVPEADLRILDPITTTAYITRNHGYMVYDVLFATRREVPGPAADGRQVGGSARTSSPTPSRCATGSSSTTASR